MKKNYSTCKKVGKHDHNQDKVIQLKTDPEMTQMVKLVDCVF